MFLHARETKDGLEQAMRLHADVLGDVSQLGATVVVDGADEVDAETASHLTEEARELANALPQTLILITSRPTSMMRREATPELVEMPLLSDDDARALISRVAGHSVTPGMQYSWPESVRDAVHRPLFAIVMGLKNRTGTNPQSTGELLAALVEDALEAGVREQTVPILRRLAMLATDAQGPIDRAELGATIDRMLANASRLVREEDGKIDFALPILSQWFAADALISNEASVIEISSSRPRLDRWLYAISIALATGPRSFIDSTMETLVAADPAFAAVVVEESFRQWLSSGSTQAPTATAAEAGASLRKAISSWDAGIGKLGLLLGPHTAAGTIPPLGVAVVNTWLTMGWYRGASPVPDVSELPRDLDFMNPQEWVVRRGGRWHDERGWSWRWGLELLRQNMKRLIESRSLRTENRSLADEALWLLALEFMHQPGSLASASISLDFINASLNQLDPTKPTRLRDRIVATDVLVERVRELRDSGATMLDPPLPPPDQKPAPGAGMISDLFSPEQQVRRCHAVYAAALDAYADLTAEWLSPLSPRMGIAATLPAILRGTLHTSTPDGAVVAESWTNMPTITWHLDPQPSGAVSGVEITADDQGQATSWEEWSELAKVRHENLLRQRSDAAGWITSKETQGLADVFRVAPVAPLVYDWLKQDLSAIKWI
jgi:hypothetical protein